VRGNTASGEGGGILTWSGTSTLSSVTANGNSANEGGGIATIGGASTLRNVTVSGNTATEGGGILNRNGTSTLINVTVNGNSASNGGGISNLGGTATLKNTIMAKGLNGANCDGVSAGSFNLSDDKTCSFGAGRDNVNLYLSPLAYNGGFTQTHLPHPDLSPAVDSATGSGVPALDQRGEPRPQGAAVDVGAVEIEDVTGCAGRVAAPILTIPAYGKLVSSARIKLKWLGVSCAKKYKVVVRQDARDGPTVDSAKVTKHSYKTSALPIGHVYYWFIKACNSPHGCTKSEVATFTSANPSPLNGNFSITPEVSPSEFSFSAIAGDIDAPCQGEDGCNIHHVDLSLFDPNGTQVCKHIDNAPSYCAFGGGDNGSPCNFYVYSEHDYRWPDGSPIIAGEYRMYAEAFSNDGRKKSFEDFIELNPE
jgi:hypothetical protein